LSNKYFRHHRHLFFLGVGSAGTGKSTLLKAIVDQTCTTNAESSGKKSREFSNLYLLNVDRKDSQVYKKRFPYVKTISFESLPETERKSCIVVEDIIHITKKEEVKLRNAINYQAHHKIQKIICASHAIYKNQIFSLLAFFNFVIFTSAISNIPTIRNVFNYFKVEPEQVQKWLFEYKRLGMGKHGIYFFFDCEKMSFNVSQLMLFKQTKVIGILGDSTTDKTDVESSKENLRKQMQLQFDKFVSSFKLKCEAGAIFSIIVNCIDPSIVRPHDLTVVFYADRNKKAKKLISIIDYINCLLSSSEIPSPSFLVLHQFIQSFCYIPNIFIRNKYLCKRKKTG
jgi:hypothetical protein